MRIVAGAARGRRLAVPPGTDIRPTSDRVRESVFNMLYSLDDLVADALVIDLFAGTGALGLEALSRGAAHVIFVEQQRVAIDAIGQNIAAMGVAAMTTVHRGDVGHFLEQRRAQGAPPVDLIFADPPYGFADWPALLAACDAQLLVAESDRDIAPIDGGELVRRRRYGATVVQLLRPPGDPR